LKSICGYIYLTELFALDKVHLHKNNKYYLFCVFFSYLFIYFTIKLEGRPTANPPLWHLSRKPLHFFSAPVFVVLKSTASAMNSVETNLFIYPLNAAYSNKPSRQINGPSLPIGNFS